VGFYLGPTISQKKDSRFIKKEYLERTRKFYEKYGGMTIIFARFIPIVRTFAPFLAGIGKMNYWRFSVYNVAGGFCWVFLFILAGYFFGNLSVVKNNFTLVIFAIIFLSILPSIIELLRQRKRGD
jgi:membrane-associated protein